MGDVVLDQGEAYVPIVPICPTDIRVEEEFAADQGSGRRWSIRRLRRPDQTLAASTDTATRSTLADERPMIRNSGSTSALCTAQPTTGANGSASGPAARRRVIAAPMQVQNSNAASALEITMALADLFEKVRRNSDALQRVTFSGGIVHSFL